MKESAVDKSDGQLTPNEDHLTGETPSTIVDECSNEETEEASTDKTEKEEVSTVLQSELTEKIER